MRKKIDVMVPHLAQKFTYPNLDKFLEETVGIKDRD